MNETMKRRWDLSRNWLEIDLDAAWHNVHSLRQSLPRKSEIMAVVKDNAYGHGAYPVAKAFLEGGATQLAVSTVEEGKQLRLAGIDAPILILSPVPLRHYRELVFFDLMPTIIDVVQARSFAARASAQGVRLPFHLKIDVGMNRYGIKIDDPVSLERAESILRLKSLSCQGIFTHLPCADDPEADSITRKQVAAFTAFCHELERRGVKINRRHVANSATAIRFPEFAFDLVRPGLALYGIVPNGCEDWVGRLKPVMRWQAEVFQVSDIPAESGVSYNHTWHSEKPSRIAVIGVGYGDGYARTWSPGAKVHPSTHKSLLKSIPEAAADERTENDPNFLNADVVGRVCMDAIVVSLPDERLARYAYRPGAEVTLFGADPGAMTASDLAEISHTIPYEVMTGINARVPRLYMSQKRPILKSTGLNTYSREQ